VRVTYVTAQYTFLNSLAAFPPAGATSHYGVREPHGPHQSHAIGLLLIPPLPKVKALDY